jgi:predicted secreted protein
MKHSIIFLYFVATLISYTLAIEVTLNEPFKEIKIIKNNTVDIILEDSPSTGYTWFLQKSDDANYELVEEIIIPPKNGNTNVRRVGNNQKHIFRLRAIKSGESFPTFEKKRSWEKGVEPTSVRMIGLYVQ